MKHGQKILIISLSGIGDLILFTPALPLIRKRFPDGEISLLVKKKEVRQLLKDNPYIDKVVVFDPQRATIRENLHFYARMRKQKYEVSLSTFPAMTLLNNLSTLAIGARERWVYKTNRPWRSFDFLQNRRLPYKHGRHRIDYNLAMARALFSDGQKPPLGEPQVYIYLDNQRNRVDQILRDRGVNPSEPLIGIHAGSGDNQPFKRWEKSKFALLADKIQQEFNFRVLFLGGPEEKGLVRKIAQRMTTFPIMAAGVASIEETLALISRCELLISNDSGVMNMAFALRKRILAIFGPTDETCTRPLGPDDTYIVKELPCKPKCREIYLYSKTCRYGYRCLRDLSVDEVWEVAQGILESIAKDKGC